MSDGITDAYRGMRIYERHEEIKKELFENEPEFKELHDKMGYNSKLILEFEEFKEIVGHERSEIDSRYGIVDEIELSSDLEKAIREHEIVIEDIENGKFFKFQYSSSKSELDHRGLNEFPIKGYEVFPKSIKIYE